MGKKKTMLAVILLGVMVMAGCGKEDSEPASAMGVTPIEIKEEPDASGIASAIADDAENPGQGRKAEHKRRQDRMSLFRF